MPLTPEQQALRDAAQKYHDRPTDENYRLFKSRAQPDLIIELFAQLEGCNEDYDQAVDSVAQLQEEVFEVRAQLEAQEAPAIAPEQQAQIERAAEMLEGYAAHLYKLMPFNPDEHPYIPSIEEAAGEMRALLARLEAQEAPADSPTITLNFERPRMWHMGCKVSHLGGNACKTISHDQANSLVECRACGKRGHYPVGAVGERVVAEESSVPAQKGVVEAALQFLADQAQELGTGHEGMLMPSPPGSAGSGELPTFDRRWSLARDGFGLLRDDAAGNYVAHDDAVAVLHAALMQPVPDAPFGYVSNFGATVIGEFSATDVLINVKVRAKRDGVYVVPVFLSIGATPGDPAQ